MLSRPFFSLRIVQAADVSHVEEALRLFTAHLACTYAMLHPIEPTSAVLCSNLGRHLFPKYEKPGVYLGLCES